MKLLPQTGLFLSTTENDSCIFFYFVSLFYSHLICLSKNQQYSSRLFLFSADSPDAQKEWIRTLLMASSTAKGGATGRGGGGGEGKGREVVLKCSCEGFTKLVKAEVGVGYEVLREKVFISLFCFYFLKNFVDLPNLSPFPKNKTVKRKIQPNVPRWEGPSR